MAKLSDRFISELRVPEGAKDVQVFDDAQPGFGVRKQASGHTTFFVKYSVGAQQRRKALGPFVPGTLAAIRKQAAVVLAQAKLGKDVVGDAKPWRPIGRMRRCPDFSHGRSTESTLPAATRQATSRR